MTLAEAKRAAAIGRRINPYDRACDRDDAAQEAVLLALRGYAIGAGLAVDAARRLLGKHRWRAYREGRGISQPTPLSQIPSVAFSLAAPVDTSVDDADELQFVFSRLTRAQRTRLEEWATDSNAGAWAARAGVSWDAINMRTHRALARARSIAKEAH